MTVREHTFYAILCFIAVIVVFLSHELAHWLVGKILDYEITISLNHAAPARNSYRSASDFQLVSLAGPIFTLLLMISLVWNISYSNRNYIFPFVFCCFYLALLSGVMNVFNTNDLGRVSEFLGAGIYTLPVAAILIQFLLMDRAAKKSVISQKMILISVFWSLLFSSIMILLDQNFRFGFI